MTKEPNPEIEKSLPDTHADNLETQSPDQTDAMLTCESDVLEHQWPNAEVSVAGYKILQRIGEGGMGLVYLAEQLIPIKRRIALKVVKWGSNTKDVIARFEAERQAVAIMNHPGIAKILDAGMTASGQPYFAMELVLGSPITTYCDTQNLEITARLELFIQVCDAVQHAHQKGIIHRDIKPSNVLVAELNDKPVPKIIDFGLAKALDSTHKLTDKTVFTEYGQVLGTLKYMSPEQAGLNSADIDTRTDIFALGIVLYELLTGCTPLDDETLRDKSVIELLAYVREHESPKPSSRLLTTRKDLLGQITSRRRTDSKRLTQQLAGDLDWIVVKALEKNRSRRYDSAASLGDDIRRYLNHEPIEARPPSWFYKSSKFVRKHRGVVTMLAAVFLSMFVGTSVATWFAIVADAARKAAVKAAEAATMNEAEAIANRQEALNAIDDFFTTVSEEELLDSPGLQPLRSKLLQKAYDYYGTLLEDADAESSLPLLIESRTRYANLLGKLGDDQAALDLFDAAIVDLSRLDTATVDRNEYAPLLFYAYAGAARTAQRKGDLTIAEDYYETLLAKMQACIAASETPELELWLVETYLAMASLDQARGLIATAREKLLAAQDIVQRLTEQEIDEGLAREVERDIASLNATILESLSGTSLRDESLQMLTQAVEVRRAIRSENPAKLENRFLLGGDLMTIAFDRRQLDPEASLEMFLESEQILGELNRENPSVISYRLSFARALDLHAYTLHQYVLNQSHEPQAFTERLEQSLALYNQAEDVLRQPFTGDTLTAAVQKMRPRMRSLLALIYNGKALVHRDLGEVDASIDEYGVAMQIQTVVIENSPDSVSARRDVAGTFHNMGRTLAHVHRYDEAAEKFANSVRLFTETRDQFPQDNRTLVFLANARSELNRMLFFIGDFTRIKNEFQSVTAVWQNAIEKTGEEHAGPLQLSKVQDALRLACDNQLESLDKCVAGALAEITQNPNLAHDTAAMMMGLVKGVDPPARIDSQTLERLENYAERLTAALLSNNLVTAEELSNSPLLGDLHASEK
ncbi:protein kinase domain-containing protein [Planctomycetaceae bacterium SH139]